MRQNLIPGLCLQLVALLLALAFAFTPTVRSLFTSIGLVKEHYGFLFSALSTALFGGLLPFVILLVSGQLESRHRWVVLAFYVSFWAWKGVEVDAFYRLQATLFGEAAAVGVVVKKICVDQFVYNPVWAAPTQVAFFLWKDCGFSLTRMKRELMQQSFGQRILVLLISSWIVWIPTVAIVYALPPALQIPLFNLALCFWCLLMTSISKAETKRTPET
jgi:hypothetical protein